MFYREGLLAPRPTPKLEDHPLSAVHDCLFNLFSATLHKGGRSSIRNLRARHAVVTGTHYTWPQNIIIVIITTSSSCCSSSSGSSSGRGNGSSSSSGGGGSSSSIGYGGGDSGGGGSGVR